MNIKLTPLTAYKVEIDDTSIPGEFSIDGPVWHGLTCLKGPNGAKIIAGVQSNVFDNIFGGLKGAPMTGQVVFVSPELEKFLTKEPNP